MYEMSTQEKCRSENKSQKCRKEEEKSKEGEERLGRQERGRNKE
jgi:hypothetical protein